MRLQLFLGFEAMFFAVSLFVCIAAAVETAITIVVK
jgi:hypothetical protein